MLLILTTVVQVQLSLGQPAKPARGRKSTGSPPGKEVGAGVGVGGSQAGSAEKPGGKVRKERGGESESSSDSDSSDSSDSR